MTKGDVDDVQIILSPNDRQSYLIGTALGAYLFGKGKIVLNCFMILDTLGNNPVADRLLLNLVDTEQETGKEA